MPCEGERPADPASFDASQLRRCLLTLAKLLYVNGHGLETVTLGGVPQGARGWRGKPPHPDGRFVLIPPGREMMVALFGQGAADCA